MSDKNTPFLTIDHITKWYPHNDGRIHLFRSREKRIWVKAVDDVSLTMNRGEVLGIIGESGCGKSTLGRILVRLESPTSGDVLLGGRSTAQMLREDRKAFRKRVQIVFQNPFDTFTPRDTIQKILMRPLRNYGIGASDEERLTMCREALEAGGLHPADEILKRYPHELSGGQLQRISIIRSMFFKPDLIIADEPVSMLDVSVRADIINMLLDLAKKNNTAVIFISHDIALTRYISDHIAVMYLGRVVEYGRTDDVIAGPRHPYTRVLISHCADVDPVQARDSLPITGEPPTPINPGPGCYFAPRCFMACEGCRAAYPGRVELENGHYVCCSCIREE